MRLKLCSRTNQYNRRDWNFSGNKEHDTWKSSQSKQQSKQIQVLKIRFWKTSSWSNHRIPLWVLYRAANVTMKKVVEYFPALTKWGKALFVSRYLRRHWIKRSQAGMHWTMARTPYEYLWQISGSVKMSKKKNLQLKTMLCSYQLVIYCNH